MAFLTVVFDLDGTLVDTAPDLIETLNVVLRSERLPPVAYDEARLMIGGGARRMLELGLRADGRSPSPQELDRMFNNFLEHYSSHIADRSRPFPGLEAALDEMEARGCKFAVCTNKLEGLSRQLLDALDLTGRFELICGQDTFGAMKPDPEVLRRTIREAGGDLRRAVMVGDSATDINTAKAAEVPVVAVDFGYTETPVHHLGPDRIISHFKALPGAVFDLMESDARSPQ
jgi:phosphoglycolate phosphatase